MIVLKALHLAIRVILVLASAFWLLICLELLPPLLQEGLDGMRGKLVHLWSIGRLSFNCHDSLQVLHEGYTDVIIFLLLTWILVEIKRYLYRRMVAISAATPDRPEQEVPQLP